MSSPLKELQSSGSYRTNWFHSLKSNRLEWVSQKRHRWFQNIPDVGIDQMLTSRGDPIGTRSMGPCFAICAIGKTITQTPILGLCHSSNISDVHSVVQLLKDRMIKEEPVGESIETYIIGGELPFTGPDEAGEIIEHPGSLEPEKEAMALLRLKKINGVFFNLIAPDDGDTCVVVTPEKIFVATKYLFDPKDEGDGDPIY